MNWDGLTIVAPVRPSLRATEPPAKPPPSTSTPPLATRGRMSRGGGMAGEVRARRELDRLIEGARTGRGAVLVLRGDPGIGKSALLDHAVELAGDEFTVLRCT